MDDPDALFDVPEGARIEREPVRPLTAGERLRARQAEKLAHGTHPLSKPGWPAIPLHRDAAPADDQGAPGLRCGGCRLREQVSNGWRRTWPKCVLPDSRGHRSRATHSDASDVRTWWPACQDYQPKEAS